MKEEINVPMDANVARQLMEALKRAGKDREGNVIYPVSLNLAAEVRMALGKAGL